MDKPRPRNGVACRFRKFYAIAVGFLIFATSKIRDFQ